MPSNVIHGREGVLLFSTSSESTDDFGTELGYTESWSLSQDRDLAEVSKINTNSKEYVEGLVGGTVSMSGSFRTNDTDGLHKIIGRFSKIRTTSDTGDSDAAAITDGDLYARLVVRPIDTEAGSTSPNRAGGAFTMAVLSNGFSVDVSAGDLSGWSYEGTVNGDVLYFESQDTKVLPKKAY
jgi:hypothetical protein